MVLDCCRVAPLLCLLIPSSSARSQLSPQNKNKIHTSIALCGWVQEGDTVIIIY